MPPGQRKCLQLHVRNGMFESFFFLVLCKNASINCVLMQNPAGEHPAVHEDEDVVVRASLCLAAGCVYHCRSVPGRASCTATYFEGHVKPPTRFHGFAVKSARSEARGRLFRKVTTFQKATTLLHEDVRRNAEWIIRKNITGKREKNGEKRERGELYPLSIRRLHATARRPIRTRPPRTSVPLSCDLRHESSTCWNKATEMSG